MTDKLILLTMVLLLCAVLGLVACGSAGSEPALEGTTWRLESHGESENLKAVLADTKITIEFNSDESKIAGTDGCNRYFGGYETSNGELTIKPPLGSTMMACPGPVMDQEQEYLELLTAAETFQIRNGKLTISCSGDKMLVFVWQ
ncbi:META domain-containing protein [Chloroflexota bacterium]